MNWTTMLEKRDGVQLSAYCCELYYTLASAYVKFRRAGHVTLDRVRNKKNHYLQFDLSPYISYSHTEISVYLAIKKGNFCWLKFSINLPNTSWPHLLCVILNSSFLGLSNFDLATFSWFINGFFAYIALISERKECIQKPNKNLSQSKFPPLSL